MPTRTLSLTTVRYRPGRKAYAPPTDIEGRDITRLFHAFVRDLDPALLRDDELKRFTKASVISTRGQQVTVDTERGSFGFGGKTHDTDTGEVVHELTDREAATVNTRVVLVAPKHADRAVFFVERDGNTTGGPALIELFAKTLRERYPDDYFPTEVVVEAAQWLAAADLLSVKITATQIPRNIQDGVTAVDIPAGRVTQVFEPKGLRGLLPRRIWTQLRNGKLRAADFLGFEPEGDVETFVEVSKGGRTKTFAINAERTPSVRITLSKEGDQPLDQTQLDQFVAREAKEYFTALGYTWDTQCLSGVWTPADRTMLMEG